MGSIERLANEIMHRCVCPIQYSANLTIRFTGIFHLPAFLSFGLRPLTRFDLHPVYTGSSSRFFANFNFLPSAIVCSTTHSPC